MEGFEWVRAPSVPETRCRDLVCSYDANVYLANHLDADIARNVIARGYGGGHAVYTDPNAQMELKRDVVKFMQNAEAAKQRPSRLPQK